MSAPQAVAGTIEVALAAWSDPGQTRSENQDNFLVADLTVAPGDGGLLLHPDSVSEDELSGRVRLGGRGVLALVADGMGGVAGGRIASHLAVAWTYRELQARLEQAVPGEPAATVAGLRAAIEAANTRVHEQGRNSAELKGMGSTVTAVVLLGGAYYVAQIGDSRAYLVRGGLPYRLTRDQSLVQRLMDAGALTPEQALHSPQASLLLQALGTAEAVVVELTWQEARRGDVLVVCSDGLFRVVADAEIAAMATATADPALLCRSLVALANERGGPDNITVVAARLEGDGLPPAGGVAPVPMQAYAIGGT